MLDEIKGYVQDHYPSKASIAYGLVCATAAIEMAVLVPYNISQINQAADGALASYKYDLSANLGGAIFYGLCSLNIIPRTAGIGASIFTLYSLIQFRNPNTYLTSRLIGNSVRWIAEEILSPLCEHVLIPVLRKIRDVSAIVLSYVGKLIINMPLPKHPVWIGVAILGTAIAVKTVVMPLFKQT